MAFQRAVPSRLRLSGGFGGRKSTTELTWRGGRVTQVVDSSIEQAMEEQRQRIEARLRSELHRYPTHTTHQLADEAFARVEVQSGRRTLTAGSTAPYTAMHELGTANFEGHPQIRGIMDQEIPHILPRIRAGISRAAS